MKRYLISVMASLLMGGAAAADEPSRAAYELAETRLMAEWVGDMDEQYALAAAYYKGEIVARDYREAFKWFGKAAEQGHAISQYRLGAMYDGGEGVPQSSAEAFRWYQKAAEQGHTSAQFSLAKKYADGEGVPQNFTLAYVWFNLAAASGIEAAVESRNQYAGMLSRDDLADAQSLSIKFFEEIEQRKSGLLARAANEY